MFLYEKAIDRYRQFFAGLPTTDINIGRRVTNALSWSMGTLKRRDRIEWFLRWTRFEMDHNLYTTNHNTDIARKFQSRIQTFCQKMNMDVNAAMGFASVVSNREFRTQVEHYLSLEIHGIDSVIWDKQSPTALLIEFKDAEEEWQENQEQWIDMDVDNTDAELIMEFPDGFAWWNLNKPYCSIEGEAMGHCGNAAARNGTVLSLRHKEIRPTKTATGTEKKEMWRPVATFIYHENTGSLGEMKGRANIRPEPKYHPYIVALLKHDMIKSIRGGGHAPGENFSLAHLEREQKDELLKEKPRLAGFDYIWKKYEGDLTNPEVIEEIDHTLGSISHNLNFVNHNRTGKSISFEEVDGTEYVVLERFGDMDRLVDKFEYYVPCMKDVHDLYENLGQVSLGDMDQEIWYDVIQQVKPGTAATLQKLTKEENLRRVARALGDVNSYDVQVFLHGLGKQDINLSEIGERLEMYVDHGVSYIFACPNVSLVKDSDNEWFLGLNKNSVGSTISDLSDVSQANPEDYQDYDYEWSEVIENGWDHLSESNIEYCTEHLKEEGIIVAKEGARQYTRNKDDFVDGVYGTGLWGETEGTSYLAKLVDDYIAGKSSSNPTIKDPNQLELDFPDRKTNENRVIKIGAAGRMTPAQSAYLTDMVSKTTNNMFNERERVYGGCAFTIFRNSQDGIWLSDIRTLDPKKGFCTKALDLLKSLCDVHNVPLRGNPEAYVKGKDLLGQRQLMAWYKKNGFRMNAQREIEYIPQGLREDFDWLRKLAGIA